MKYIVIFEESRYIELPLRSSVTYEGLTITFDDVIKAQEETIEISRIYTIEGICFCILDSEYQNFEREQLLTFGVNQQLHFTEVDMEWLLDGMTLHMKQTSEKVYHNGVKVYGVINLEQGDILQVREIRLVVFEHTIHVYANERSFSTSCIRIAKQDLPFEGYPYYRKSPRIVKRVHEDVITILDPPKKATLEVKGVIATFVPTLMMSGLSIGVGIMMGRGVMLISSIGGAILTFVTNVTTFIRNRKQNKVMNEKRFKIYDDYMHDTRRTVFLNYEASKEAMRYNQPKLQQISKQLHQFDSRLYERSVQDMDFLSFCIGYTDGKSPYQVNVNYNIMELEQDVLVEEAKQFADSYNTMKDIPVSIDLKKSHVGIVGDTKHIHQQLKAYLYQLTYMQSYHDVEIIMIYHEDFKEEFSYIQWYPHIKIHAINVLGNVYNEKIRDQVLSSVYQMLKERKLKREEEGNDFSYSPHFVFVIDDSKMLVNHTIMEFLQLKKNDLDYSIIYTTNKAAKLPENIKSVVYLNDKEEATLIMEDGEYINQTLRSLDSHSIDFEQDARLLASIIHEEKATSQIPESITFLQMLGITSVDELPVSSNWKKHKPYKSLSVPLGLRAKDDIVYLDLHEKAHGPHGLVAGTTGSGKSEIVQSYILSLAAHFHPHDVGFLLIDYKGGGMANLFKDLPHLLGTITNLDGAESMRALVSIQSELKRRQRVFDMHDVNNINSYHKKIEQGEAKEPLPHLFIISDEFAELKKEQPEFMKELVSTARIGRSLGVHLILATQKPTGVVDDQIWSNSKFKLCLKVQSESDSKEMLKTPDAASLTLAGRAYLQVGNNEVYELFQSAYSGAPYAEDTQDDTFIDQRVYLMNDLGQGTVLNDDLSMGEADSRNTPSELQEVIRHIKETYEKEKTIEVRKPWLPSLSSAIVNSHTLNDMMHSHEQLSTVVQLGVMDVPDLQLQKVYELDFQKDGNILYVASGGYGKTMFLGNIILNLASKNKGNHLEFYLLDFGNGGLQPYLALPHVADYIALDDDERFAKFLLRMEETIAERKKLITTSMTQNFTIYNKTVDNPLEAIVIAIDGMDMLKEKGVEIENRLMKIIRDGVSLGIYTIMSASRVLDIRSSTLNQMKQKIVGNTFDPTEALQIVGRSEWKLNDTKGRTLVKDDGVHIMQTYLPIAFEDELDYVQKLQEAIQYIKENNQGFEAKGIAVLPNELHIEEYSNYTKLNDAPFYIGLEASSVKLLGMKILGEPFVVIGPQKSGKTTFISNIVGQLEERVYILDNGRRMLSKYQLDKDKTYCVSNDDYHQIMDEFCAIIEDRQAKWEVHQKDNQSAIPEEFYQTIETIYVVIDDVEYLYEMVSDVKDHVAIIATLQDCGIHLLAGIDSTRISTMNKFSAFMKRTRTCAILGTPGNFNILNLKLSTSIPIGFAYVETDQGITKVMYGKGGP